MSGPGRNPQLSDEEYIDLVSTTCRLTGAPMAPTPTIYEKHELPFTSQTLKNNLERLSKDGKVTHIEVGSGFAWAVSPDSESGGKVDFSEIRWDDVDIESIPLETLREHPDFQSIGERHTTKANNVIEYAVYITLVGGGILLVHNTLTEIPNTAVVDFGAIAFAAGFLFVIIGISIGFSITFITKLSESHFYQAIRETISDLVPFRISRDEGSITFRWK